jgi:hypothetical protein
MLHGLGLRSRASDRERLPRNDTQAAQGRSLAKLHCTNHRGQRQMGEAHCHRCPANQTSKAGAQALPRCSHDSSQANTGTRCRASLRATETNKEGSKRPADRTALCSGVVSPGDSAPNEVIGATSISPQESLDGFGGAKKTEWRRCTREGPAARP